MFPDRSRSFCGRVSFGPSLLLPAPLCLPRAVRALWPSQSITSITWGFPPATSQLPGDDVLHLPIYAVRQVASARFVHAWLSLEEGPSLASLRLYASCLLRSAKVVQVRVGFTYHAGLQDLLDNIFHVPAMPGNMCWYLRTSCAEGRFAPRWTASFQGEVLQAIHNYSARKELCEDNVFCLSFSARELLCFWNGHLASSCQLPPHLAFPNYKANLRWFCVLETEQDLGGLCNAVVAVQSRLPSTTELPVAGVRFHCLETLCAPDLSLSASHMVYVAAKGNASTGLRCEIQNVAAFVPDGDIVLGFTTQQAASTLEQLLRDLHRAPRGTVGVHLLVRRGRVVQHKLLSQNTSWEDCGQNVEPPAANHVTVQLLQVGPSLQYGRNGHVVETWSLRPLGPVLPRPAICCCGGGRDDPLMPSSSSAAAVATPQRCLWADERDELATPSSGRHAAAAASSEGAPGLMKGMTRPRSAPAGPKYGPQLELLAMPCTKLQ